MFKTEDGGATWSVIDVGGLFPNAVEALYVDPETPGTVYAATREGVFKTIVGGELE